jgi:hypothetical protein
MKPSIGSKYSNMVYTKFPRNNIGITWVIQKGREITVPLPNFPYVSPYIRRVPCTKPDGTVRTCRYYVLPHITSSFTLHTPQHGVHTQTYMGSWGRGGGVTMISRPLCTPNPKEQFRSWYTRNNCSSAWWILKTWEENCSSERKRKWRKAIISCIHTEHCCYRVSI